MGMTNRKIKDRAKEHIGEIIHGQLTTASARVHSTDDIQIDPSSLRIIFPCNNFFKATITESIDITNQKNDVSNEIL